MRVRTISLREALDRAKLFAPECASLIKDLHLLIAVRDGIVHLADASAATVEEVLVVYLKATEELRAALADVVRTSYWGGFVDLVDSALRENVEQARLRVEAALAVARAEFARRFAELDEKTKTAIRSTIVASYSFASDEEQLIHCPACETEALVSGSVIADYEPDWDQHDDGRPWLVGVSVQVLFTPDGLLCNACHLELNGRDEMNAAGVGDPWYLEDIDVWINAYEPDY